MAGVFMRHLLRICEGADVSPLGSASLIRVAMRVLDADGCEVHSKVKGDTQS
jgi:hypothetical protein